MSQGILFMKDNNPKILFSRWSECAESIDGIAQSSSRRRRWPYCCARMALCVGLHLSSRVTRELEQAISKHYINHNRLTTAIQKELTETWPTSRSDRNKEHRIRFNLAYVASGKLWKAIYYFSVEKETPRWHPCLHPIIGLQEYIDVVILM